MKRFALFLSFAAAAAGLAAPASAQSRRDNGNAWRSVQQGNILPLNVIRERVRIDGATFIGADLIGGGDRYRLRYMRGAEVIWIDVDARTGRVLGRVGG